MKAKTETPSATDLERLRRRDRDFLAGVFRETNPLLIRVCRANKLVGPEADDVVSQTWETFFANLDRFEGRSSLSTFVCGILINKIREHRRAFGRFVSEDDSENVFSRAFTQAGWWNEPPAAPDRLFEIKSAGEKLTECLEGLTEQQRIAFILREVDGEESRSIGAALGVTVEHLRVLLYRAKTKLRQCLEGASL